MEQEANKPIVTAVIITFIIAFWLGFFAGWFITGRGEKFIAPTSQNEEDKISLNEAGLNKQVNEQAQEPVLKGTISGIGIIRAEDQLAGETASVASATLEREGWVVIHEEKEGRLSAVLGAAWLPAGSHEQVKVSLLRGMEAGRRYYAMLHHEAEEDGSHLFDLDKDLPLEDTQGNIIMASFNTISSPR